MTGALVASAELVGLGALVLGVLKLAFLPLALGFEVRARARARAPRRARTSIYGARRPPVSVVVPAYNEGNVLEGCVSSLMRSTYPDFEVILVDDGSTDDTYRQMQDLAARYPRVRAITKPNGGKGSALNAGIALATGEVLLLSDSDGVFEPAAIGRMVEAFVDDGVGAVCGDDRPVNLDRVQTRFLAVISHVGTGLVRRALDVLRCLPIVSGNIGAFRRDVLERTGGLHEDTLGEDLELTWRIYRAGYRVVFAPSAIVYAESPSTLRGLWRQRVRWGRGLLQTFARHRSMVGNPRHGTFGLSLPLLALNALVLPVAQIAVLLFVLASLAQGLDDLPPAAVAAWQVVLWLGVPVSLLFLLVAIALNGAWRDLRFAWTLTLWPLYSILMSAVFLKALDLEVRRAPQRWNKLERTGVVSLPSVRS
ncbi:glucosaminyltransferase [Serinibacter arcticus]|uniref:Glucosaminyltransferase n=1 Tax=Serinibacter arcticus TaxID=1655435 RepID=A0A2U1ZTV6_9MICO|nr:glycosyltransferase family 2 protein [Serinibacter arcticus]PWD50362.1 glucosaminyltransferase [Serinibacter arcticus]